MQIVTDTGMDLYLPADLSPEIPIHVVPHLISLDGLTYRSGEDISAEQLQKKLMASANFPITSTPSSGEFAALFKKLAAGGDPDILCINLSSGLSGTFNAASTAATMVPEAHVTVVDTKTLCAAQGWTVAAAARALKAGWPLDEIVALIHRISFASQSIYTLDDLKYLIHGGRISHMRGLLGSLLRIRPLIGVEKVEGKYTQLGTARTSEQARQGLLDVMTKIHKPGTALRVQVLHAYNEKAALALRELIANTFDCQFMPIHFMSPALAAHTGPTMVGVAFAPQDVFKDLP
jgi:DegV family protein with EDD domain